VRAAARAAVRAAGRERWKKQLDAAEAPLAAPPSGRARCAARGRPRRPPGTLEKTLDAAKVRFPAYEETQCDFR